MIDEIELDRREIEFRFHENNQIINGGMSRKISTYICLPREETIINIDYEFNAKNFISNGVITVSNEPIIIDVKNKRITHNKDEARVFTSMEDIIEEEERTILSI